jgi:hypothetical protein
MDHPAAATPSAYHERPPERHETIVYWAMTIPMSRRLARRSVVRLWPGNRVTG